MVGASTSRKTLNERVKSDGGVYLREVRDEHRDDDLRPVRQGTQTQYPHETRWHFRPHFRVPERSWQGQVAYVLWSGHDVHDMMRNLRISDRAAERAAPGGLEAARCVTRSTA